MITTNATGNTIRSRGSNPISHAREDAIRIRCNRERKSRSKSASLVTRSEIEKGVRAMLCFPLSLRGRYLSGVDHTARANIQDCVPIHGRYPSE